MNSSAPGISRGARPRVATYAERLERSPRRRPTRCADRRRSRSSEILRHAPHLRYLLLVRRVAECFLERRRIPVPHRIRAQQARAYTGGGGFELEPVGLHPEGDRRKKGIDGRECPAGQPRAAEAPQARRSIARRAGRYRRSSAAGDLVEPDAHAAAHRAAVAQLAESRMHLRGGASRPSPRARNPRPNAGVPFGQVFGDRERVPHDGVAVDQARDFAARRNLPEVLPARCLVRSGSKCSVNLISSSRISTHGRSDQDE